jgi:Cu-processing system permease protein
MGYIYMEALLIMTITIAASSRLSTLASGGLVFGLFGIAFVGGWVEQIGSLLKNQTAVDIGILTSLIMPSESLWRRAASLTSSPLAQAFGGISPFSVGSVPSPAMIWYSAAYLLVMLGIALRSFNRRDL